MDDAMFDKEAYKTEEEISVKDFAGANHLQGVFCPSENIVFSSSSVNRPGFILSGYEKHFPSKRIQVFGRSEISYLRTLEKENRVSRLKNFFSYNFPAVVITRGQNVLSEILEAAKEFNTPIFKTDDKTSNVVNDLNLYLSEKLAPSATIPGTLLDIYGIGVLITGRSGIGKSETALELVHRGHRFVSDDIVEIRSVKSMLFGTSPKITANMMEIRGIGIIDVKAMYGVGAVLKRKGIQINIALEDWDDDKSYNRTGTIKYTSTFLGVEVPKYVIPVVTGRNLAVLAEVAVKDFRLKEEGYNPLSELEKRMD